MRGFGKKLGLHGVPDADFYKDVSDVLVAVVNA